MLLKINDGSDWNFVNGNWKDGEAGEMLPVPGLREDDGKGMQAYRFAFSRKNPCRDFEAGFQVMQTPHSDVGLIFGAKNSTHFHVLHFPCCGQAYRAQHFWAALSMMDESGYVRNIKMQMVNRVNSMVKVWHDVRVSLKDGKLDVVIDGRGRFEVQGIEKCPGFLGTMMFNTAAIRNINVEAVSAASLVWDSSAEQAKNWSYPCPTSEYGKWQMPANLVRTPGGDLLLYFSGSEGYSDKPSYYTARSSDNGKTWSKPEFWWSKEDNWEGQHRVLHAFPDGRLRCMIFNDGTKSISVCETSDDGWTWSKPEPVKFGKMPDSVDKLYIGPQAFINLHDGAVMMLSYGSINTKIPDTEIYTWGSLHCQGFVCRSEDSGYTWSDPVSIDGIVDPNTGKQVKGNMDHTEICGVQTGSGSIVALIRPVYSPWMWEARSDNEGKTWEPCVRGPFPGYATPNMVRTKSGYLLVAHRLPGLTIHASYDDGMSWDQGTMIDSAVWAMGSMLEIEPDVVLYVYWDSFESLMRTQYIKVTPHGLIPYKI